MKRFLTATAILALAAAPEVLASGDITPLWLRDAKISPDGTKIAFCYKGDIYTVPTSGGHATPLMVTPGEYEAKPVWSPDSKSIAFQSDKHGNFDIFLLGIGGGVPTRLTYNSVSETPEAFTPDGKSVVYSASIQDPARSALFPSGRMTELYEVSVKGGQPKQILATPVTNLSFLPDGSGFLYQDTKGFEDTFRKHHTSSVTRDILMYKFADGKHINLTNRAGEDTDPVAGENGNFYYLSELPGKTYNVFASNIANPSQAKALTDFKTHPVRFLSGAKNGTLAFTYDGEIYTLAKGASKPSKLNVTLTDIYPDETQKMQVRGMSDAAVSPDGKSLAFISRGDVYVTSVEYSSTKQITKTPAAESDITWSSDGKKLIYVSERDGKYNIYEATLGRDDDQNFSNATVINEKPMFKADGHERTAPIMSPDGKKLAFILDRNTLAVMDMKTKAVKSLTDPKVNPERNGRFYYTWSPDSKWIALTAVPRMHEPYYDVCIVNVGNGDFHNLTNSGYFDENPKWVMDGNAIMFASERYGMRNHASWGSEYDIMLLFLNQDAYDRFRLNEEDYALLTDLEKAKKAEQAKADKKDKKDDKKGDGDKKDDKKDANESKDIKIDWEGIEDRVVRLTPMSSQIGDGFITSDGKTLYYTSQSNGKRQLWKSDLRKGDLKMISPLTSGGSFVSSKDGKTWFLLGYNPQKFTPGSDKFTPISYTATMTLDPAKEREFMFDNMVREEAERFYTKDMHGVDWPAMTKAYRKFLPHINNNYDFAELASEILGELNVSHTGGRFSGYFTSQADRTASLGLLYDMTYTGKGKKVDEVLAKGPFNRASSKVKAGDIIEKINGEELTPEHDLTAALLDAVGKKTLVSIYNPASGERWDEVVKPISAGMQNSLLYDRWIKQRAADVDRLSNGRLGYVHIQSMGDDSFRKLYSDALGKYIDKDGLIIDIRWNGGGRLHEDLEVFLTGEKYLTQEIRGIESCVMPSRRWTKPSIMLMSEACYSNAHGSPWVYKHQNIGKLVGMPVPGTMTSVNWVTMQDPTLVYGIPVIGYRTAEGTFLENSQLEPDVKVANDPSVIVTGEDQQLKAAVDELLKEIDAKKARK